nr:hypothetical protein [Ardenticatena sp.]
MAYLTRDQLRSLMEYRAPSCVTIYMPTSGVGPETQKFPIHLKNLLTEAQERLIGRGLRAPEAEALLQPARTVLDDRLFWQNTSRTLAMFVGPDVFETFHLPHETREMVYVADRFAIKPLLRLFANDGRFYVLALNLGGVRLYEGSKYTLHEIPAKSMPKSLGEVLQYDEFERTLQFHSGVVAQTDRGTTGSVVFHGQGGGGDENWRKEAMVRYLKAVDAGLREMLGAEQPWVVLAGVAHLRGIFREVSRYPRLAPNDIDANPETLSLDELHARAYSIMRPIFMEREKDAIALFEHLHGTQSMRAATDIREVVPAAYFARVEVLFADIDRPVWGTFDRESGEVQIHLAQTNGSIDLLDFAVVHTLRNGGTVFVLPAERMPVAETPVAAIFRY